MRKKPRKRKRGRTRPEPKKIVSSAKASRLRRKWRAWSHGFARDLGQQLLNAEMYGDLGKIVRANPAIQTPPDFHYWIATNYAASASVAVRRLVDRDRRSVSPWRLLYEMLEFPSVVTRRSHRAIYSSAPHLADATFDRIVGAGRLELGPRMIRGDLRKLEDAAERIRRFVDKKVAHSDSRGPRGRPPVYADIDQALKVAEEIVVKYHLLLTGQGALGLKPTRQHNWSAVLRSPWIVSTRGGEEDRPR